MYSMLFTAVVHNELFVTISIMYCIFIFVYKSQPVLVYFATRCLSEGEWWMAVDDEWRRSFFITASAAPLQAAGSTVVVVLYLLIKSRYIMDNISLIRRDRWDPALPSCHCGWSRTVGEVGPLGSVWPHDPPVPASTNQRYFCPNDRIVRAGNTSVFRCFSSVIWLLFEVKFTAKTAKYGNCVRLFF